MSVLGQWKQDQGRRGDMTIAEAYDLLVGASDQVHFEAYDGSSSGPADARYQVRLKNPRGLAYVAGAPSSLGFARAYLMDDLEVDGFHPGDPYDLLAILDTLLEPRRPPAAEAVRALRAFGRAALTLPAPPPNEVPSGVHRALHGLRHSRRRDAEAIHHHYDVSNRFYEMVLGPSMAYTCACYPSDDATLEEAQANKFDLVCRKLGLKPGMRLLDVGCGWGGMVRHAVREYGVTAIGVTLSAQQAAWAQQAIEADGMSDRATVRYQDYREVTESGFDAVSSIGLTEHIGIKNYPSYFEFLYSKLVPGGRLLNHCITRADNLHPGIKRRGFIDRYVFPDGELAGAGTIIVAMQNAGFELQHEENLRRHYARTLAGWCRNLVENWDECVAETDLRTAKVWGLYMAGSRLAFERRQIELHQVLGTRTEEGGDPHLPMRPDWGV
ncbi:class I SAM-dependent methyltransferase [Angustibacter sp. Root456]|uniref:class I SAM-dependent methyltransferase n=1 Tax=Angustibacter sp. Root456 TaxID=1736539 RepID=UPI0006F24E3A|nr:class I SAM-dependent methyltransferase [Angustibacter sp. Root456]KQX65697.1 cyclopropane-fatty-acyl-phospholipid synthase [Angustibacter sp. Root456]